MRHVSTVLGCWRYPVTSASREAVEGMRVTERGVVGDRRWAVMDADGMVVSAKHPARGGRLLHVSARHEDASGAVTVQVPGEPALTASDPEAGAALSEWLGHPVTLTDVVPDSLRLHRLWPQESGMVPEWATGFVPVRTPSPRSQAHAPAGSPTSAPYTWSPRVQVDGSCG